MIHTHYYIRQAASSTEQRNRYVRTRTSKYYVSFETLGVLYIENNEFRQNVQVRTLVKVVRGQNGREWLLHSSRETKKKKKKTIIIISHLRSKPKHIIHTCVRPCSYMPPPPRRRPYVTYHVHVCCLVLSKYHT